MDCGLKRGVAVHGFIPAASKTDNFKVHETVPQEIDTRFHSGGTILDGMHVRWTDPLGASNDKWSYWAPQLQVFHEAHVEAVESGTHYIQIGNQPGCAVGNVSVGGQHVGTGPMTAAVKVSTTQKTFTIFVDVDCT